MSEETFEIICNECRAAVASTVDVCPSCGAILFKRNPPPGARVAANGSPAPKSRRRFFGRRSSA